MLDRSQANQEAANAPLIQSKNTSNRQPVTTHDFERTPLLGQTGSDITALIKASSDDAAQTVCPTPIAHLRAHKMILQLQEGGLNTPADDVYSDADGAIRLLWNSQCRSVELVFPSDEKDYIYLYHSAEDEYGVEPTPSPEVTLDWINWVLGGSKPNSLAAA